MQPAESRMSALYHRAVFIAISVLGSSVGCSRPAVAVVDTSPSVGSSLKTESLKLIDLDGKPFDLQKTSEGRVHVAVFTRTDCPVSNQAAPEIRELFEKLHSKGVDFYLIYVDPSEKPESIREHLRQYEYPCAGVRDPDHTLVAQTGATVTPEAVVFDSDWRIAYRGRINNEKVELGQSRANSIRHDLKDAIEATLAGQPIAEPVTRSIGCYIGDLK